jgi:segregation and condensation protein B
MPSEIGTKLKNVVEAALLAAGRPLGLDALVALFPDHDPPERSALRDAIERLTAEYAERGVQVRQVGSGWRIEVRSDYAPWISRLWEEKPPRYSRALLETLALIAYRQPITRGEIEGIRGVSVSTSIMKTLQEREWVRVVGHRDVPGKPALYATTRAFLDYFGLKGLDELPTLAEIKDLDSLNAEFSFMVESAEEGVLPAQVAAAAGPSSPAESGEAGAPDCRVEDAEPAEGAPGGTPDLSDATH